MPFVAFCKVDADKENLGISEVTLLHSFVALHSFLFAALVHSSRFTSDAALEKAVFFVAGSSLIHGHPVAVRVYNQNAPVSTRSCLNPISFQFATKSAHFLNARRSL